MRAATSAVAAHTQMPGERAVGFGGDCRQMAYVFGCLLAEHTTASGGGRLPAAPARVCIFALGATNGDVSAASDIDGVFDSCVDSPFE